MMLMRMLYLRELTFLFLVWSLFLAIIPYGLVLLLPARRRFLKLSGAILCVLFLPNAPYMITDLFHLRWHDEPSIWFDTLLIASFAWNGILLYFHTLHHLEQIFADKWQPATKWMGIVLLSVLCAFGIYIGRYLRFNSWDVFTNLGTIIHEISDHIRYPLKHPRTWSMTLVYMLFLVIGYFNFISFGRLRQGSVISTNSQ